MSTFALLIATLSPTFNDANWVEMGGLSAFAPHKTVQMLGEDINIKIFDERVHVKVFFSFKNHGGKTSVKMGFPFSTVSWNENFVKSYSSTIDGKPVKSERLLNVPLFEQNKDTSDDNWTKNEVYVKTVEFDAGQTRTISVEYVTGHGFAGSGYVFDSYIIESGATWAGSIQNISITVDWSHTKNIGRPDLNFFSAEEENRISPDWTMLGSKSATTTISNIEPDFNLNIGTITGFWSVLINDKQIYSWNGYYSDQGPCLTGDPKDPRYRIEGLPTLFPEWAKDMGVKEHTGHPDFIGWEFSKNSIKFDKGTTLKLKRGFLTFDGVPTLQPEQTDYIYLKDFISSLGGKFNWNAELERIEITLPAKQKPTARK